MPRKHFSLETIRQLQITEAAAKTAMAKFTNAYSKGLSAMVKSAMNFNIQGTASNVQEPPSEPPLKPAPRPSRKRAFWNGVRAGQIGTYAWDVSILFVLPLYVAQFVATPMFYLVAQIMISVFMLVRRSRLIVTDWRMQKLAYFTGVLPREKIKLDDDLTMWLLVAQCLTLPLMLVLMWLEL